MKKKKTPAASAASLLWIDFVNTQVVEQGRIVDRLTNLKDWTAWLSQTGAVPAGALQAILQNKSRVDPESDVLARVLAFRSVLREGAEHIVRGSRIPHFVLAEVNRQLSLPLGYPQLVYDQTRYRERVILNITDASQLQAPIAQSFSHFLCNEEPELLRKCENPECILFFYDTSKNHSRRWCSMKVCGNRLKVSAYYQRRRGSAHGRSQSRSSSK
jgi:predicted RNA-binding Zn ribbon-like protein